MGHHTDPEVPIDWDRMAPVDMLALAHSAVAEYNRAMESTGERHKEIVAIDYCNVCKQRKQALCSVLCNCSFKKCPKCGATLKKEETCSNCAENTGIVFK